MLSSKFSLKYIQNSVFSISSNYRNGNLMTLLAGIRIPFRNGNSSQKCLMNLDCCQQSSSLIYYFAFRSIEITFFCYRRKRKTEMGELIVYKIRQRTEITHVIQKKKKLQVKWLKDLHVVENLQYILGMIMSKYLYGHNL